MVQLQISRNLKVATILYRDSLHGKKTHSSLWIGSLRTDLQITQPPRLNFNLIKQIC